MYRVTLSPRFLHSTESIAAYIFDETGYLDRALGYIGRMRRRAAQLGQLPHIGTHHEDVQRGLRTVPFEGSAVIAFLVDDAAQTVTVLDVAYGGRQLRLKTLL